MAKKSAGDKDLTNWYPRSAAQLPNRPDTVERMWAPCPSCEVSYKLMQEMAETLEAVDNLTDDGCIANIVKKMLKKYNNRDKLFRASVPGIKTEWHL